MSLGRKVGHFLSKSKSGIFLFFNISDKHKKWKYKWKSRRNHQINQGNPIFFSCTDPPSDRESYPKIIILEMMRKYSIIFWIWDDFEITGNCYDCQHNQIFRNMRTHVAQNGIKTGGGQLFFVYILKYFKKYVSYDGELVRSKLLIQEDLLDWYFQHILLTARKSFYEPLKSKCSVKICKIIFQISKLWTFF